MHLLIKAIRCLNRSQTSKINLYQQFNRIHQLTPIYSAQNFLQFKTNNLQTPGLRNSLTFSPCSSFHTQNSSLRKLDDNKKKQKSLSDDSKAPNLDEVNSALEEYSKLGLVARFKKMAKEYWYVLIPVHVVTSSVWLGSFYYASTSGVDIAGILESYNFSETIINHLRNSSLGHIAVAYFLYKIATPARYFVTIAGTTVTIKQGIKYGFIKPMPSKEKMVQMYQDKKGEMQKIYQDKKDEMHQAVKDKKQAIRDKYMKK